MLAVVLCAVSIFSFASCVKRPPTVQEGILIIPQGSQAYSKQTEEYAQNVIYEILEGFFQKTVISSLPQATINKLKTESKKLQELTSKAGLSETQYKNVMLFLEENTESYVGALARLYEKKSEASDYQLLKGAYTELASKIGAELLGEIFYELAVYRCEYIYDEKMSDYKNHGYGYSKQDAEKAEREKRTLQEEIGKENFVSVIQMGCFLSELVFGGAFEGGQTESFSDLEILLILKQPSFNSITVKEDGWPLLFEYMAEIFPAELYATKLYEKFIENGDAKRFAAQMQNVVVLFTNIQNKLTIEQAAFLRKNEKNKAISSLFANFEEEEWALFERITSVALTKDDYLTVAREFYGDSFDAYCSNLKIPSLAELKNAVGRDDFSEKLLEYIAGISPAFSYGVTL